MGFWIPSTTCQTGVFRAGLPGARLQTMSASFRRGACRCVSTTSGAAESLPHLLDLRLSEVLCCQDEAILTAHLPIGFRCRISEQPTGQRRSRPSGTQVRLLHHLGHQYHMTDGWDEGVCPPEKSIISQLRSKPVVVSLCSHPLSAVDGWGGGSVQGRLDHHQGRPCDALDGPRPQAGAAELLVWRPCAHHVEAGPIVARMATH